MAAGTTIFEDRHGGRTRRYALSVLIIDEGKVANQAIAEIRTSLARLVAWHAGGGDVVVVGICPGRTSRDTFNSSQIVLNGGK